MNKSLTPPIALWHVGPQQSELRETQRDDWRDELNDAGSVHVRTKFSLISRGTERLIWEGRVPEAEQNRMRAPHQEGNFPFPVKYGYAAVGLTDDDLPVFALYPHQTQFSLPSEQLRPIPHHIPLRRAALAANMETALNAVWDSGAGPGDRICVVGAGLVGCLVARLCQRLPGADVTLVDRLRLRDDIAVQLNVNFASGEEAPKGSDIVFHTSASEGGLATAMGCLGDEATLVEMSWYGDRMVSAPLGGAFHAGRHRIISSQVGSISPSHRLRWDYARRMDKAIELLDDPALDHLIDREVAFADLPNELPSILAPDADGIATIVTYD
jgi:hypothetical protein